MPEEEVCLHGLEHVRRLLHSVCVKFICMADLSKRLSIETQQSQPLDCLVHNHLPVHKRLTRCKYDVIHESKYDIFHNKRKHDVYSVVINASSAN